jgi:GntR family transcriptional regulator
VAQLPGLGIRADASPRPLYEEISSVIRGEIHRGNFKPGSPLPPERVMCEQLGVSRVTLRKALVSLANDGLLVPSHGRAWFVADSLIGELPSMLQSLTELAFARGLRVTSRVTLVQVREATLDEADELGIGPGAPLFEMRRLRRLDNVPIDLDHVRLPLDICPHLPEVDFESASLYETLERHGVRLLHCDFAVQAVAATPSDAEQLQIPPGSPLLLATGTTFAAPNRRIELSHVLFIGERYRFRSTLYRNP